MSDKFTITRDGKLDKAYELKKRITKISRKINQEIYDIVVEIDKARGL